MESHEGNTSPSDETVLLRQLAENIREVFWLVEWTTPPRILYVSPGYEEVWGQPAAPLYKVPKRWLRSIHPEDRREVVRLLQTFVREGKDVRGHYRIIRHDGNVRWIWHQSFHVRDWTGQVPRAVGLGLDVTEQKELEHKAQQAQKLESLVVLAGGVAHDFNNILASIMGNVELAQKSMGDRELVQAALRDILVGVRRASDLSSQMYVYAGRSLFSSRLLDLVELVQQVCEGLRLSLNNCRVRAESLNACPPVWGEEGQLRQLVVNLVTNASESMSDGGEILVRLQTRELEEGDLQCPYLPGVWTVGSYVCLEVIDTGCGIESRALERLFDPFYSTKFTGRGLGLAAVLGIVRRHGGLIDVTSTPGVGTRFFVAIPAPHGSNSVTAAPQATGEPARANRRVILFADDDPQVRGAFTQLLTYHQYEVLEAEDGLMAVKRFGESRLEIGCVILDLSMPRMDGWQALHHIRAIDPEVPIIVATGYSQEVFDSAESRVLVSAFLQKPFQLTTLLDALNQVMGPP